MVGTVVVEEEGEPSSGNMFGDDSSGEGIGDSFIDNRARSR